MFNQEENRKLMPPRKKRRKYTNDPSNIEDFAENTLVNDEDTNHQLANKYLNMSIIDRVLDFNKYNENTSLYSLCRDWINATASNRDNKIQQTTGNNQSEEQEDIGQTESSYLINKLPEPADDQENLSIKDLNEKIRAEIRASENTDLDLIKTLDVDNDVSMQTHVLLKLHVSLDVLWVIDCLINLVSGFFRRIDGRRQEMSGQIFIQIKTDAMTIVLKFLIQ